MSKHGMILFGHGARDPRWAEPFERLATKLRTMRSAPVSLAFLELMTPIYPRLSNAWRRTGVMRSPSCPCSSVRAAIYVATCLSCSIDAA